MTPEQISTIKKETKIESGLHGILQDTRTKTFMDALTRGELTIADIVVQFYLMGWEDHKEST